MTRPDDMQRIFIGGIGRSGTTIALNALYRHQDIYAVPVETKFLVEEDGFADLIRALTRDFSVAGAAAAVRQFESLMRRRVTGLDDGKFRQQHMFPSDVFAEYHCALDRFLKLVRQRRYFADPAPLLAATRQFCAATFDREARESGHAAWVEKTPSNIWRIDFLRALWPDCIVIHLIRDPADILLSLMERGWLPDRVLPALTIFEGYMAALLQVRRARRDDADFIEVRLEDLVADTHGVLQGLVARLRLSPFDDAAIAGVAQAIADYYRSKPPIPMALSRPDRELADEILRPARVELDYVIKEGTEDAR